ncbi:hypothetical protein [uncultured Roseobacter sp.]|uniref:hypothetical protein n=1 Tax=uncultured Roseobacter sp. TaxID=114847 RepID=UPI00261745B0|nr:hypothetical protein [uncultured Roseobacter sp.]
MTTSTAQAWEFTPGLPCRLNHDAGQVQIELTYDPTQPLYSISLTLDRAWPQAPRFDMAFGGGAALAIATDRHRLSPDGRTLTVTDQGFGNVLDGLQFNTRVTAGSGVEIVEFPLIDAAEPVAAFRRCEVPAGA